MQIHQNPGPPSENGGGRDNAEAAASSRSTGFYAPSLDGLRCVAVVLVMLSHFSVFIGAHSEAGQWGVRLFFVLSGFLITSALLHTRAKLDDGRVRLGVALKEFFLRRIFRLWPVYFLALAVAWLANLEGVRASIWWHVGMATNQYIFHIQHWPVSLPHFWTLAVEQQFYLFWPFVLFLVPRKWMPAFFILCFALGPLSRELILALRMSSIAVIYTPLSSSLDFFATGAIIAWGQDKQSFLRLVSPRLTAVLLSMLAVSLLVGNLLKLTGRELAYWPVYDPMVNAIGFGAVIVYLLQKPAGPIGRLLGCRAFTYIGEISYGIYVYHLFMHSFEPRFLGEMTGPGAFSNELIRVLFFSVASICVAIVSHHFFEQPLRRLGRKLA